MIFYNKHTLRKWNLFFKKYQEKIKRNFKGYLIEKSIIEPTRQEVSSNNKQMAFWFLNLYKEGSEKMVSKNKSNYPIQWELAIGENSFFELHGKADESFFLEKRSHTKIVSFFTNKYKTLSFITDFLISNNYISSKDLVSLSSSDTIKNFVSFQLVDPVSLDSEKGIISLKFVSESELINKKIYGMLDELKQKDLLNQLETVHSFSKRIEGDKTQRNFQWLADKQQYLSSVNPFDSVYDLTNLFGYDSGVSGEGKTNNERFEEVVSTGSWSGRFKTLPTIVEGLDAPIELKDGLGFSNYLKSTDYENLLNRQFMLNINKFFLPVDSNKIMINNVFSSTHFNDLWCKEEVNWVWYSEALSDIYNQGFSYCPDNFILNSNLNVNLGQDYLSTLNLIVPSFSLSKGKFTSRNKAAVALYKSFFETYVFIRSVDFLENFIINICGGVWEEISNKFWFSNVFSNKIYNILQWKYYIFYKYNINYISNENFLLERWLYQLRNLFLLKADIGRNFGMYLEQSVIKTDTDENTENKKEDVDEDNISLSNFTYKIFVDDVYEKFLTNPGTRPYKWLTMPELQYSPFLYFFNNFRSIWFFLFEFYPRLTEFTHVTRPNGFFNQQNEWFFSLIRKLVYMRYILGDDKKYHFFLLNVMNSFWFKKMFGSLGAIQADFFLYLDSLLLNGNFRSQTTDKYMAETQWVLKSLGYLPKMINFFDLSLISLEDFFFFNSKNSSFITTSDWLLTSEKSTTDHLRLSLLYKMGVSASHFNFFSFMSPDFFERGLVYQRWMRFRTADRVKDPENPFLILDFFRPHTIELTPDVTLLKYRLDFLKLISLGFNDIVFEKQDIFIQNFYGYNAEKRDIFNMPEYTIPFFFFDSDLDNTSFVPTKPVYERVSSFALPSLDRPWKIEEYINVNSENIDYELLVALEEDMGLSEEELKNPDNVFLSLQPLWKKDKPGVWFSEQEISVLQDINDNIKKESKLPIFIENLYKQGESLQKLTEQGQISIDLSSSLYEWVLLLQENIIYYFFNLVLNKYREIGITKGFLEIQYKLSCILSSNNTDTKYVVLLKIINFLKEVDFFLDYVKCLCFSNTVDIKSHYKIDDNVFFSNLEELLRSINQFFFFSDLTRKHFVECSQVSLHQLIYICEFFSSPLYKEFSYWKHHFRNDWFYKNNLLVVYPYEQYIYVTAYALLYLY